MFLSYDLIRRLRIYFIGKSLNEENSLLIRGAAGSFVVKFMGAGLTFAAQIVVARFLGAESFGNYIYVLTWVNVLLLLGKLGFDMACVKYVAVYHGQKNWALLRGFLRYSTKLTLTASILVGFCLSGVVWVLKPNISKELFYTFLIGSILLPVFSTLQVREAGLRGLKKVVQAQIPQTVLVPFFLLIGLPIGVYWLGLGPNAMTAMSINIGGSLIAVGLIYLLFQNALPEEVYETDANYESFEWFRVAWGMIFVMGFNLILYHTDTIMVGALIGTTDAGIYAVASRLVGLMLFVLLALNSILAPLVANSHAKGLREELQRMVSLGVKIVFFTSIFIGIGLIFGGKWILSFFGPEFQSGYSILLVLIGGQFVNAMAGPVALLLNMTGYQNQAALVLAFSAVLNITLNALLIPKMGPIGAAVATAITTAVWNIIMALLVWYRLGIISVASPMKLRARV